MNYIENIAAIDCQAGNHMDPAPNTMLIQIADPTGWMPSPKYNFKEKHQFRFADVERGDPLEESGMTNQDAANMVFLLQHALKNKMNIVVHCVAGICRSGAVVEVAEMMGFAKCSNFRIPNLMVKHKMLNILGWTYKQEEPLNENEKVTRILQNSSSF